MKKFSKDLRDHASKIINYEKKKMISLTTEKKIIMNKKFVIYARKNLMKRTIKIEIIVIIRVNIGEQHIICVT